jgi:DNA polymerase III subunit epsilon
MSSNGMYSAPSSWGQAWAQSMLDSDPLIIDFETTGFRNADIVQIGILDAGGQVLMEQLIKPSGPIPYQASAVHGITDAMVVDAPGIDTVFDRFADLIAGRVIVAYNSEFELEILRGVRRRYKLPPVSPMSWNCAMKAYARFRGVWNHSRGGYRWYKLTEACMQQGIQIAGAHRAIGDCTMTLALLRKMAGV